jgi:hypothetical protein
MDFKKAARLGSCLSKDYAEEFFRLLATYSSISASEAASRLNLHIQTSQDFLEELYKLEILHREDVYEKKRPYFRYSLRSKKISMELDLSGWFGATARPDLPAELRIRERKNSRARFTTSRSNDSISSVVIWTGEGRDRRERKINLSQPQGKFLFHLPFPNADFLSVQEVMEKAGVEESHLPEILDIVNVLTGYHVIEALEGIQPL